MRVTLRHRPRRGGETAASLPVPQSPCVSQADDLRRARQRAEDFARMRRELALFQVEQAEYARQRGRRSPINAADLCVPRAGSATTSARRVRPWAEDRGAIPAPPRCNRNCTKAFRAVPLRRFPVSLGVLEEPVNGHEYQKVNNSGANEKRDQR